MDARRPSCCSRASCGWRRRPRSIPAAWLPACGPRRRARFTAGCPSRRARWPSVCCSAALGLILLYPRVRMLLRGQPHLLAAPAGLTLAVTLATLPITLLVFQSLSIVSPLAHVLAVPLVPAGVGGTPLLILAQPSPDGAAPLAGAWWLPTTL